jgi:hypothetical protein
MGVPLSTRDARATSLVPRLGASLQRDGGGGSDAVAGMPRLFSVAYAIGLPEAHPDETSTAAHRQ